MLLKMYIELFHGLVEREVQTIRLRNKEIKIEKKIVGNRQIKISFPVGKWRLELQTVSLKAIYLYELYIYMDFIYTCITFYVNIHT